MISKKYSPPQGFSFLGSNIGLKKKDLDFGVIHSKVKCRAVALFTKNLICGAPIIVGKDHLKKGYLQTIVVNSKNANVHTGKRGIQDALTTCKLTAKELSLANHELVLPSSTGVIGNYLPLEKIKKGISEINPNLGSSKKQFLNFCQAILTTDTYIKWGLVQVGKSKLLGIAKGAGMVEPNLATMLVYFITDAKLEKRYLKKTLQEACASSFNALTIDGDTSTSDTVALLANGLAGKVPLGDFSHALNHLSHYLAQEILRDGEGISKIIELTIKNADNLKNAKTIAKSILNSFLVKTAFYGNDPNWGRIIMAIGKTQIKKIKPEAIKIFIQDSQEKILLSTPSWEKKERQKIIKLFKKKKLALEVDLEMGNFSKTFWGTDASEKSVALNSQYTT